MSKELPTFEDVQRRVQFMVDNFGGGVGAPQQFARRLATDLVQTVGWLEVAPEPTPEPDDPENYLACDALGTNWTPTLTCHVWAGMRDLMRKYWSDIPQPVTLFRKVGE